MPTMMLTVSQRLSCPWAGPEIGVSDVASLIAWSLRHRLIVLAAAATLVVGGTLALFSLSIDAFPDTTPVQVQINTIASGLAPEEVERQITFAVEQALGGLKGLEDVRSISKFGLSQVVVTFDQGTDVYFARQQLNERLGAVSLPEGIDKPTLGPVATGLGEVFQYVVRSDTRDLLLNSSFPLADDRLAKNGLAARCRIVDWVHRPDRLSDQSPQAQRKRYWSRLLPAA